MQIKSMLSYCLNRYKKILGTSIIVYAVTAVLVFLLELKKVQMNSVFSLVGSMVLIIISLSYQDEFFDVSLANSVSRKTSTISIFIMGLVFSLSNALITIVCEYAMEKFCINGVYTASPLITLTNGNKLSFVGNLILQLSVYFSIVMIFFVMGIMKKRLNKILVALIWIAMFGSMNYCASIINSVYDLMCKRLSFDLSKTGNTIAFFCACSFVLGIIYFLFARRCPCQSSSKK